MQNKRVTSSHMIFSPVVMKTPHKSENQFSIPFAILQTLTIKYILLMESNVQYNICCMQVSHNENSELVTILKKKICMNMTF